MTFTIRTLTAPMITTWCDKHQRRDGECGCDELDVFTFATQVVVNDRVFEASFGTYRDVVTLPCPECGAATCRRDLEFATGERLLSGYCPHPGEIVRNNWSACPCGWNQAS